MHKLLFPFALRTPPPPPPATALVTVKVLPVWAFSNYRRLPSNNRGGFDGRQQVFFLYGAALAVDRPVMKVAKSHL